LRAQCRHALHHRTRRRYCAVQSCRWWTRDREEPRVECENEVRRVIAESRETFLRPFPVQGVLHVVAFVKLCERRSDSFLEWSDRFKRPASRVWPNTERSAAQIYFLWSVSTAGRVAARTDFHAGF